MFKGLLLAACTTLMACDGSVLIPYTGGGGTDEPVEDTAAIEFETALECLPRHEQKCGADGHIHWFDSCGSPQDIAVSCDANATCDDAGEAAECRCNPAYEGDGLSCEPCVCTYDGLCCDQVCPERGVGAPCDDEDTQTIGDVCVDTVSCAGVPYCRLYHCPLPVPTGQNLCFLDQASPVSCPNTPPSCAAEPFCGQDFQYATLFQTERLLELDETTVGEPLIIDPIRQIAWPRAFQPAADLAAANALCDALTYGGHDDWRVPTAPELLAVVHLDAVDGTWPYALDEALFGPNPVDGTFWSATPYAPAGGGGAHWAANYRLQSLTGRESLKLLVSDVGDSVRCVRQTSTTRPKDIDSRFVELFENDDLVVLDRATRLSWQVNDYTPMPWENALVTCEQASYGGHGDWRLPNLSELASLVDFDRQAPATVFPNAVNGVYWSSTSAIGDYQTDGFAWAVDFSDGSIHCGEIISDTCSQGIGNTIQRITRYGQKNLRTVDQPNQFSQCPYDRQEYQPSDFYVRCVRGRPHNTE